MATGDDEPAEDLPPVRLEALTISTSGNEPLPPTSTQDVPRNRSGRDASRSRRRAGAQAGQGPDQGSHGLAGLSSQTEPLIHIDEAIQEALRNPKHRMLVLRVEDELREFVQSTRTEIVFAQSLTGFQRLLTHRVGQFYGLETSTIEEGGQQGKIVGRRTSRTALPLVKLADAVHVTPRSRTGGSDASRVLRKKPSMGSRGSADSDSGKATVANSIKESMESLGSALEGSEAQRIPRRESSKWDLEGTGPGNFKGKPHSGKGPLGLEIRPLLERQQDHRAKARAFAADAPLLERRASGHHSSASGSSGVASTGGLLARSLGRESGAAQYRKGAGPQESVAWPGGRKAALRAWEQELPDADFHREFPQAFEPGPGEQGLACPSVQRTFSSEFPHWGMGVPPPPPMAARTPRVGPLSDPGSPTAAVAAATPARASRGAPQPQVMVPMQLPLPPEQQAGRFMPVGNVAPLPAGYGQPMQIPPGYAFVPTQPPIPGMGVYGQGHLVPISAMQAPHPYGYMAAPPAAQGMEGTPLPMIHMAAPRPALPVYADYHPAGSYRGPQGYGIPVHAVMPGPQQPPLAQAQYPALQQPLMQHPGLPSYQPHPQFTPARSTAPRTHGRRAGSTPQRTQHRSSGLPSQASLDPHKSHHSSQHQDETEQ